VEGLMRMPTAKDGTIIIRVPLRLKEKIEDLAKEKNISSSEFIRKLIEDSVFKDEKEIEEQIMFINQISKHINELLKESVMELGSGNAQMYTKEIGEYKKLLYTHQSKVIKLMSGEIKIDDSMVKLIKDDLRFLNLVHEGFNQFIMVNKLNENYNEKIEQKEESIAEMEWEKTDRLYSLMLKKYEESQDIDENNR
jgi:hypothetical protein